MWPLIAGMAAGGLLKSELIDRPREDRQRQMQAEIARYSPWSGMQANPGAISEADPFGSALQGGMTGAAFGQNMDSAAAADKTAAANAKLTDAQTNAFNTQNDYYQQKLAQNGGQQQSPWMSVGRPYGR